MSRRDESPMDGGRDKSDLKRSAERLEEAAAEFARSASSAASQKARVVAEELERATRRMRDSLDDEGELHGHSRRHDRGHRTPGRGADGERATRANGWLRDLYREPERGWIAGVCAGVARYYQVEPWVARLIAFSLLLFIPQIAFWAYIIAIFMLKRRPAQTQDSGLHREVEPGRSPAPELGPRLAPRNGVRTLRVRYRDLELRMRRMESYVTSREFTLNRELSALESEDGGPHPGASRV